MSRIALPLKGRRSRSVRTPKTIAGMEHVVFLKLLKDAGIATPKTEVMFARDEGRKFAMDYAWPDVRLAVECEGGVWSRGSHGRGSGIVRDMEKGNLAVELGWRILRFTTQQLALPSTIETIQRCLTPSSR